MLNYSHLFCRAIHYSNVNYNLSSLKPLRLSFNVTSPYILMDNCYSVNLEPNDPMLSYSHAHRLIISFFHKGSNCVLEVVWIYKGNQKKWFEIITTNGHT